LGDDLFRAMWDGQTDIESVRPLGGRSATALDALPSDSE
jgi:hypothetical protein